MACWEGAASEPADCWENCSCGLLPTPQLMQVLTAEVLCGRKMVGSDSCSGRRGDHRRGDHRRVLSSVSESVIALKLWDSHKEAWKFPVLSGN